MKNIIDTKPKKKGDRQSPSGVLAKGPERTMYEAEQQVLTPINTKPKYTPKKKPSEMSDTIYQFSTRRGLPLAEASKLVWHYLNEEDEQRLYTLLRYGLADINQFELFRKVMKDREKYIKTQQYRDILLKVFNRLLNLVTKDNATYQKAYQAIFRDKRIVESTQRTKKKKINTTRAYTEKPEDFKVPAQPPTNAMQPQAWYDMGTGHYVEGFEPRALGEPELTKRYAKMTPGQKEFLRNAIKQKIIGESELGINGPIGAPTVRFATLKTKTRNMLKKPRRRFWSLPVNPEEQS